MDEVLLPAFFAICAALGIPQSTCKPHFSLSGYSQTDKALWYIGSDSRPDDMGLPDSGSCYRPVPIAHYKMFDGSRGTTYACLAPPEDDEVTPDELDAIAKYASRVNNKRDKTLRDHETALTIKHFAAGLASE